MLYCLARSGYPLGPEITRALLETAQEMWTDEESARDIQAPSFEGRVTTDFERAGIGTVFGIRFTANIESIQGKTNVVFIVHDCDLANRDWLREHSPEIAATAEKAWLN